MIYLDNDTAPTTEITKTDRINIDDLFIQKQRNHVKQINTYNKIINKINEKIRFISRRSKNNSFLWYNIPQVIIGYTNYSMTDCIAFVVIKLEENGFSTQFIPPNTLFISWANFVPSYVRNEIKKRTGIIVDNQGNQISTPSSTTDNETSQDPNNMLIPQSQNDNKKSTSKKYNPIIPY